MSFEKAKHKRRLNTIGFRLTLWGTGITMITCSLLCVTLYAGLWYSLQNEVDGVLEGEVYELTSRVFKEHAQDYQAAQESISVELSHRLRGDVGFRLLGNHDNVLVNCDSGRRLETVAFPVRVSNSEPDKLLFKTADVPRQEYSVRICSWLFKEEDGRIYTAQASYLLDQVTQSLATFRRICIISLFAAAVAASAGGRVIATRSLRPIQAMTAKANQISAKELDETLPRTGTGDELDRLAETLNEMLNRIRQYVTGLRQFTADASHEFRSPLAALRGNAEVALTRQRSETELRAVIEESIEQYDRLGRIAEDLLLLARADTGHLRLQREKMLLDQAIADVVDLYTPLAQDRDIKLAFANRKEIWLEADGPHLRQLVGNLVDNAIRYSGPRKGVVVSLASEDGVARITVTDDGPGISADHLSRVFDRFYRVDPSRSGQGPGGAGLGLSISRTVAEAHGGKIDISSVPGEGTRVTVLIPLNASAGESS